MQNSSFVKKLSTERDQLIRFISAKENGDPCWFYVKLNPEMFDEYKAKIKAGDLDIREYGNIIESDWGHYPPADVIKFMQTEYGFDTPPAGDAE